MTLFPTFSGTLNGDVRLYMEDPDFAHFIRCCRKGHGRIENRRTSVCRGIDRLRERHGWPLDRWNPGVMSRAMPLPGPGVSVQGPAPLGNWELPALGSVCHGE